MKPTPGPWRAEYDDTGGYDCMTGAWQIRPKDAHLLTLAAVDLGSYGQLPCNTPPVDTFEQAEANARLIAAAPDLLVACQEFVRKCDMGEARSVKSYAEMKAAITKALGQ